MSQPTRVLLALVAGLLVGALVAASVPRPVTDWLGTNVAQLIGTVWLNALQMTVIPLVVSLLVTGVASTAQAAGAGRLAGRVIVGTLVLLLVNGAVAALITPLILAAVPIPGAAAEALRGALGTPPAAVTPPTIPELLAAVVPTNIFSAASGGALLSLIFFTLVFAFALMRIEGEGRALLVRLFAAIRDAMLVVVGWVLLVAPLGVFALAFLLGARAGGAAFGALIHYLGVICTVGFCVTVAAYLVVLAGARVPIARFARRALPAQVFAVSTQSSLATLPAMLKAVTEMGVPRAASGVTLPLGVAMFRATQPAMNTAIAIYIGHWFGVAVTPGAVALAVLVGTVTSLGSISLPSQITFFASVVPIASAMGVPLAPLGLLIAVETIPDIFRTLGNVTSNLALTAVVTRDQPLVVAEEEHIP